jgi:hypothetical protein
MRCINLKDVLGIGTSRYVICENGEIFSVYTNGKAKTLKPTLANRGKGYLYVSISDAGRIKKYYVHQLVAMAFIDNPESRKEVNHLDCNTQNNHVSNLEWSTRSENLKHAWDNGMMDSRVLKPLHGEDVPSSKLSKSDVISIRAQYNNGGTSYRKLASQYGVGNSAIQSIIERKTWKHI